MNLTEILIKHQSDKGPMPPEGHNYGPFYENISNQFVMNLLEFLK